MQIRSIVSIVGRTLLAADRADSTDDVQYNTQQLCCGRQNISETPLKCCGLECSGTFDTSLLKLLNEFVETKNKIQKQQQNCVNCTNKSGSLLVRVSQISPEEGCRR